MAKTFLKDSTDSKYLEFDDSGTDKILEAPDETGLATGKYVVEIGGAPVVDSTSEQPFVIEKV